MHAYNRTHYTNTLCRYLGQLLDGEEAISSIRKGITVLEQHLTALVRIIDPYQSSSLQVLFPLASLHWLRLHFDAMGYNAMPARSHIPAHNLALLKQDLGCRKGRKGKKAKSNWQERFALWLSACLAVQRMCRLCKQTVSSFCSKHSKSAHTALSLSRYVWYDKSNILILESCWGSAKILQYIVMPWQPGNAMLSVLYRDKLADTASEPPLPM